MSIKLSIITPVFNNVNYITRCIQNVIDQACDPMHVEHVIIDGASTDGTKEIIESFAVQFPHIRFVSEKDSGQSNAMNKGIQLARGEYISFLNVDDYYSEHTISEVLDFLSQPDTPDFLVGNCHVWLPDGQLQYTNRPNKLKPWHFLSGYYLPVNPSAYFYKRRLHESTGPYNEANHFNMDLEFLIKASMHCEMMYVAKTWGNFCITGANKTAFEQESGLLERRKKALYDTFLAVSNLKIRWLTRLTKWNVRSKRTWHKTKKMLGFPFDAVYWKTKKVLGLK